LTDRRKTGIYPRKRMHHQTTEVPTAMSGMWVLLTQNDGELPTQDSDGRVPVIARAGNDKNYLLVFKNVAKARQFVAAQDLSDVEPRMVVRGNRDDIVRIAKSAGVVGTLVDYDPTSQQNAAFGALA
jgi:hypothetical protein